MIRALLRQLPAGYTCAWLKNEYGDAGVDAMVAQDERVAVKEIVNGCLCCTKVGDLADALRAATWGAPDPRRGERLGDAGAAGVGD